MTSIVNLVNNKLNSKKLKSILSSKEFKNKISFNQLSLELNKFIHSI